MRQEIRKSDGRKNYYTLIEIDDEHNQTVLGEGTDLDKLKEMASDKDVPVVNEKDTRNTVDRAAPAVGPTEPEPEDE